MKQNLLLVLILTAFGYACSKKEDAKPNTAPSAFTITSKQTNSDLLLIWTKAKVPEGDLVSYTVIYKDTLAKNITDTSYVIKNVPYASTSVPFSVTTVENPYVLIPEANFEKALIALKIDDVQDGKLLRSSAESVSSLYINNQALKNLQGIEAFKNLTSLECSSNQITNLDLSKNSNLDHLSCNNNRCG